MSEENQEPEKIEAPRFLRIFAKGLAISIAGSFAIVIILVAGELMTGELVELQPAFRVILIVCIGLETFWISTQLWIWKFKGDGD